MRSWASLGKACDLEPWMTGGNGAPPRNFWQIPSLGHILATLGAPWHPCRAVKTSGDAPRRRPAVAPTLQQQVQGAGRGCQSQPMISAWHPRPRLPRRFAKHPGQCTAMRAEGVIKTEWSAVLPSSKVDRSSLYQLPSNGGFTGRTTRFGAFIVRCFGFVLPFAGRSPSSTRVPAPPSALGLGAAAANSPSTFSALGALGKKWGSRARLVCPDV